MAKLAIEEQCTCAYCGKWVGVEPEYSIHRDGFADGPEVPLCVACGEGREPNCEEIWSRISRYNQRPVDKALN